MAGRNELGVAVERGAAIDSETEPSRGKKAV